MADSAEEAEPRIEAAIAQYASAYFSVCNLLHSNSRISLPLRRRLKNIWGRVRLAMLDFLNQPNLPIFYMAVDDDDFEILNTHEQMIMAEWEAVDRKEKERRAQNFIQSTAALEGQPTIAIVTHRHVMEWKAVSIREWTRQVLQLIISKAFRRFPFEDEPYRVHHSVTYLKSLLDDPETPEISKMMVHLNLSMCERPWGAGTEFLKEAKAHLEAAVELLKVAKETYIHDASDTEWTLSQEKNFEIPQEFYRKREMEMYGYNA